MKWINVCCAVHDRRYSIAVTPEEANAIRAQLDKAYPPGPVIDPDDFHSIARERDEACRNLRKAQKQIEELQQAAATREQSPAPPTEPEAETPPAKPEAPPKKRTTKKAPKAP